MDPVKPIVIFCLVLIITSAIYNLWGKERACKLYPHTCEVNHVIR